jgi:hypothetical protein
MAQATAAGRIITAPGLDAAPGPIQTMSKDACHVGAESPASVPTASINSRHDVGIHVGAHNAFWLPGSTTQTISNSRVCFGQRNCQDFNGSSGRRFNLDVRIICIMLNGLFIRQRNSGSLSIIPKQLVIENIATSTHQAGA